MGMFASLNIRPCRILIIDEILCVLLSCSFSRFAHSTDSSMLALLACYNEDVENTHSKDFSFWYFSCLSVVSFHRTTVERERKKKEKKNGNKKENDEGNKTIFFSYQRTRDRRLILMMITSLLMLAEEAL